MGHPDHWVSGRKRRHSIGTTPSLSAHRRASAIDPLTRGSVKNVTTSETGGLGMEASTREGKVGRLLRFGVSDGARSPSGEMLAMAELETELALLREENARLKVERHRPADTGHVIERMRSIRPEPSSERDGGTARAFQSTQAVVECLAMRDGLMTACQEVQQAMQGIRSRLGCAGGRHTEPSGRSRDVRQPGRVHGRDAGYRADRRRRAPCPSSPRAQLEPAAAGES